MAFGNLYRVGLASTDPGSPQDLTKIYGNGTIWSANVVAGDSFEHGGIRVTILSVDGDEELTLAYDWPGAEFTDEAYIIRQESPTRHTPSELAGRTADLLSQFRRFYRSLNIYGVEEFGVNTPPVAGYDVDDMLVVGTSPTGSFTGHENEVAQKTANGWSFLTPERGWITIDFSTTPNLARNYDGDAQEWVTVGSLLGAPIWNGAWNSSDTYAPGALVTYQGRVYAADNENTNSAPDESPADWTQWGTIGEHGAGTIGHFRFRTTFLSADADVSGRINMDAAPDAATLLRVNVADIFQNDWSTTLSKLATGTSTRKGRITLLVPGEPTKKWQAVATAAEADGSPAGRYDFTLEDGSPELGQDTFDDNDEVLFQWSEVGDEGEIGATGAQGERGLIGGPIAIPLVFKSETADADPGNGNLRLNAAQQEDATGIRVDILNSAGGDITAILDSIPQIGTGTIKAIGSIVHADTPETKWILFQITAHASATGYRNLTIEVIGASSANPFTADDAIFLNWLPVLQGEQGSEGIQGETGEPFTPDFVVASIALRDAHNSAPVMTSVLVETDSTNGDRPTLYFLLDNGSPVEWSEGFDFVQYDASLIAYDNAASGATASNMQDAVDELFGIATEDSLTEEDVASAATTDIGATLSRFVRVTGTATITSFGTEINKTRFVRYNAAATLTHNATSLVLIGGANRTVVANSWGIYRSDSSGNWREIVYQPSDLLIGSNTYTPTLTAIANIDSVSLLAAHWRRQGGVIHVTVAMLVDTTAAASTTTTIAISLPVASNFSSEFHCIGGGSTRLVVEGGHYVTGNTTNDRAELTFLSATTGARRVVAHFSYIVLA